MAVRDITPVEAISWVNMHILLAQAEHNIDENNLHEKDHDEEAYEAFATTLNGVFGRLGNPGDVTKAAHECAHDTIKDFEAYIQRNPDEDLSMCSVLTQNGRAMYFAGAYAYSTKFENERRQKHYPPADQTIKALYEKYLQEHMDAIEPGPDAHVDLEAIFPVVWQQFLGMSERQSKRQVEILLRTARVANEKAWERFDGEMTQERVAEVVNQALLLGYTVGAATVMKAQGEEI